MRDLYETIAFFADLGLSVLGRATVSGEWADTAVGLMAITPRGSADLARHWLDNTAHVSG